MPKRDHTGTLLIADGDRCGVVLRLFDKLRCDPPQLARASAWLFRSVSFADYSCGSVLALRRPCLDFLFALIYLPGRSG